MKYGRKLGAGFCWGKSNIRFTDDGRERRRTLTISVELSSILFDIFVVFSSIFCFFLQGFFELFPTVRSLVVVD